MQTDQWEGAKMKKPIEQILPNPHRNFDIYPIGEQQVSLLIESINEVGMFLGLPARKTPNGYEIACGHHRLDALKRTGATHVDLAVSDYSDEEMLKIMIRENSTQRGNENFGAVLDSVGAVLVQCVRDVYYGDKVTGNIQGSTNKQKIENGEGIGWRAVQGRETSLSQAAIRHALSTFRSTNLYLDLLKKGGLPEGFWHLYESEPLTKVEAVAMFPKPAHAAAWVRGVSNEIFQERFSLDDHPEMVSRVLNTNDRAVTVLEINAFIQKMLNPNVNLNPEQKPSRSLDEQAEDVTKSIRGLYNKINRFMKDKGDRDCYVENVDSIIDDLIEQLEQVKEIRAQKVINI